MIRIRDDDVLMHSSSKGDEFTKFKMIHEWICEVPDSLIHVPTILVTEIQEFPDCIEYIRQETAEGRMLPEIHGLTHHDHAALTAKEISMELSECQDWIFDNLGHTPTKFYTPWGAGSDARGAHIKGAAKDVGLELVTCEQIVKLEGRLGVINALKAGWDIKYLNGGEIFLHWWQNATRLKRVIEVIKHGSWAEAKAECKLHRETKRLFRGQ
jgi:peptidoglycan/xylan/chitin deacetylase (PgdA/CDA1 family)